MKRPVLSSWSAVIDYCRAAMAFEEREQFRILFLDSKNALIADEVQQTGTVDHTPVYPREVVRRALELSATAVILVHNHPSGDPTPSRADIDDDQADRRRRRAARHRRARPHHHRPRRPREPEGAEADVRRVFAPSPLWGGSIAGTAIGVGSLSAIRSTANGNPTPALRADPPHKGEGYWTRHNPPKDEAAGT